MASKSWVPRRSCPSCPVPRDAMGSVTRIVSLSREQLHAMVWREPMTAVAARFGITDVALRKKCVRHSVPVPPRGFWQQRGAGTAPAVAILPGSQEDGMIDFCVPDKAGATVPATAKALPGELPSVAIRTRADHRAEARQDNAARRRRIETAELAERDAQARALEERQTVAQLEADALAWERAQRLRAYIAAMAATPVGEGAAQERSAWIEWATRQAEAIDPLQRGSAQAEAAISGSTSSCIRPSTSVR